MGRTAKPKKALEKGQLQFLTDGSAFKDGSHKISRVTFIENSVEIKAFYKELAPKEHYPELLAKMSVGASIFKRIFQGNNSAEERLVLDKGKIVGTLSIAIDGFKSFNFKEDSIPTDNKLKEQVIPSTKTLLLKKIIYILFGRWYGDDDDGHPHNIGFAGDESADLDFDMFWYWFTIHMKEPRPIIGVPKKGIELTVRDYESFPVLKDAKPYHSSTYDHPGQETLPTGGIPPQFVNMVLPKAYADPSQFAQLAREKEAHEQKFAIAMKALLTYDPDMVRARLIENFGDMTLNYTSLDETGVELRMLYEREYKDLCNENTNIKPFVDFMMTLYQKHYDNLYRVVVFYMGCENNGHGLSLSSTSHSLYHKPSYYQEIVKWVTAQNKLLSKEESNVQYDLNDLQKRYHQVWRDANAPAFKHLLLNTDLLTKELITQAIAANESSKTADLFASGHEGKNITDDSLTSVLEYFGEMTSLSWDTVSKLLAVDTNSNLREAVRLIIEFNNKFHTTIQGYYGKEREQLTEDDNLQFAKKLNNLYEDYDLIMRQKLSHTTTQAAKFNLISVKLKQLAEQVHFQRHLTTTDEQMEDKVKTTSVQELLPHTHETVIKQFNETLFVWAKELKPEELADFINNVIDTEYKPSKFNPLHARQRAQPVKDFLLASKDWSGDNRLAYILSSGTADNGALNTSLVQHLSTKMLEKHSIPSIQAAKKNGSFDKDLGVFTISAVQYAKTAPHLFHHYSSSGVELIFKTMYSWLDTLDTKVFDKIVENSLVAYEKQLSALNPLSWFGISGSRKTEVEQYVKEWCNSKAVALTFLKGKDSSTLNTTLFHQIIAKMQLDIKKNPEKLKDLGYKLIAEYNAAEHKVFYDNTLLKEYAEAPSHKQKTKKDATAASSTASALVV